MPARLSSPNMPMWSTTWAMSASPISRSRSIDLAVREARLGPPAQVEDDLDQRLLLGQRVDGVDDLLRQRGQQRVEVVDRFAAPVSGQPIPPLGGQRTPAGTRAGSATRTSVSFISRVTVAIVPKPASSSRRSIGDSYVRTGAITPVLAARCRRPSRSGPG